MRTESYGKTPSNLETHQNLLVPKAEIVDFDELPPQTVHSTNIGDNAPSSSGSNLRSFFVGMGFSSSLVDQAILENGADNVDFLLETLFTYSALQKSNHESFDCQDGSLGRSILQDTTADSSLKEAFQNSGSSLSDSLNNYFRKKEFPEGSTVLHPKDEPYDPHDFDEAIDDTRASLLMMKFSVNEVEVAINKLGINAPIDVLVDFITAAQIADEKLEEEPDTKNVEVKLEDKNEKLFGTMEKTLHLLQMGFSENEVSTAFEILGQDAPITELANAIFMDENEIRNYKRKYKLKSSSLSQFEDTDRKPFVMGPEGVQHGCSTIKSEGYSQDVPTQARNFNLEAYNSEELKEEFTDAFTDTDAHRGNLYADNRKGKRPKMEYDDPSFTSCAEWMEEKVHVQDPLSEMPNFNSTPRRSLSKMVACRPYFFYGNIVNTSFEDWKKISQFLYAIEPEFVNTQFFSAMNRREGYVHNLPIENRFFITPEPLMTIQDAIPRAKQCWPAWDKRNKLSYVNCERNGILQLCDRLGRIMVESRGQPSREQQIEILHYCRTLNLIWVGKTKLSPMEPENLELILGYPPNHTQGDFSTTERLQLLRYCFQTDTLGYHLSELKFMFPEGLTVLSLLTGLGGAEIALHRLGIPLKTVVSVETCDKKRKILKRWWNASGQKGVLVQIEDIQKLTSTKLHNLVKTYGNFDFIICQNPSSQNYSSKVSVDGDNFTAYDFSLFCEFVRILQGVRNMCAR